MGIFGSTMIYLLFVTFLLQQTLAVCPEEKTVGETCYTRVAFTDTSEYGCIEGCTYKKSNDKESDKHYCFKKGPLPVSVSKCSTGNGTFPGEDDLTTLPSGICQSGWNEFNGRCYYFLRDDEARSWNQAKAECEELYPGANLPSIGSQEDDDYIARNTGRYIWIFLGGTDAGSEGQWTWTDGSPWVFSKWTGGEPNGETRENCMTMKNPGTENFWNDSPCDFVYNPSPLICSYKPGQKV